MMQTVSPAYNPYPDSRRVEPLLSFRLIDLTAASDADPSAVGEESSVTQLGQTHDGVEGMTAKYATLETDGWPLDGSCAILPDDVSTVQTGFWSVLSDENGEFSSAPTLTFEFDEDHDSFGFTIIFDDKANRFPQSVTVSAYDASDALIGTETTPVTSVRQVVELSAADYRKIIVSFGPTQKPYQRVRVAEVIFGVVEYFDRHNLSSAVMLYEVAPAADALPSSQALITFDNTDRRYNMTNPSGLFSYLQQGQPLDAQIGVGETQVEYVNMGRFYFQNAAAKNSAMTAQIVASDRFMQLDKSVCRIGETGTWTLVDAVAAIVADCGIEIQTVIPAEIGARTINKCIPADASHREALRLSAQAAMCTCYFNRLDELVFADIDASGDSVEDLTADEILDSVEPSVEERINAVELTVRDEYAETETIYTASDLDDRETPQVWAVDNPLANDGASVAAWLLEKAQHRLRYTFRERGNPARELADVLTAPEGFSTPQMAIIRQEYRYDGTLSADIKGWA